MGRVVLAVAVAATVVATAGAQTPDGPSPAPSRTVWDGVYSLTQAARGETSYNLHCASCHRDDLAGYDGLLRGRRFMEKYREASVHLLFDKTKSTMPRNAAGTLSDQTYLDIVSFVLKTNEFPSGIDDMQIEDIPKIRLVGKSGPEPVPSFSLVQVVGCLSRRDDGWVLMKTTEPVRTGDPRPAAGEVLAERTTLTGAATFGLMVSPAYTPTNHSDRIVEVRGFLIRRPNEDRINITSIETVGPGCRH
jgi:S-disulfanyl-L-cysteine oxidoreductase SoxD